MVQLHKTLFIETKSKVKCLIIATNTCYGKKSTFKILDKLMVLIDYLSVT